MAKTDAKDLDAAVVKAAGDRERAVKNVCKLYSVNRLNALPGAIKAATLALIGDPGSPVPKIGPR